MEPTIEITIEILNGLIATGIGNVGNQQIFAMRVGDFGKAADLLGLAIINRYGAHLGIDTIQIGYCIYDHSVRTNVHGSTG